MHHTTPLSSGVLFDGLALTAEKQIRIQIAFETAFAAQLVQATFHATHCLSRSSHALKGRAGLFGRVAQTIFGDHCLCVLVVVHMRACREE